MKYLSSLIVSALLFLLLSALFGIEVLPLYGSIVFSFLASSLVTSIASVAVSIVVMLVLAAIFYAIAGKTGALVSVFVSLVIMYIVQFNLMQYFGQKLAWYPSFSSGQIILYLGISFVINLLLMANEKKN